MGGQGAAASSQRGAQRLSASQRWALKMDPQAKAAWVCSTPFGITEVGMLAGLFNSSAPRLCSTPFGITEVGIPRRPARPAGRRPVLNAFRHHRGGHLSSCQRRSEADRVLNAFRHHRGGHSTWRTHSSETPKCAQRLSASQRWAWGGWTTIWSGTAGAQRLSASQRWASAAAELCLARHASAQRLSASQRWAYCSPSGPAPLAPVLNAFRHHRGGHLTAWLDSHPPREVLNAFRHHRGGHRICYVRDERRMRRAQRLSASQRWASPPPKPLP